MTPDDIVRRLRAVMEKAAPARRDWAAVDQSAAIRDLGFDSLSLLDLLYDIEQEFRTEFDAEALLSVQTVGDLVAFLHRRAGSA
jgi:acyl carrier protein